MKRTLHAGYRLNPMQVAIFKTFDSISAEKTVVLARDLGEAMREVEKIPETPTHPRMTRQMTIPEMDIIQGYTFFDYNNQYKNLAYGPMTSSLWKWQHQVKDFTPDSTVIQVCGDAIHQDFFVQFIGQQDVGEIYTMMRNVAFERGELLAEYNQAIQRFPNTPGITEWYKAIASVDPNKKSVLREGYYVEDYIAEFQKQKWTLPPDTPSFMKVYITITAAANTLSQSIDDTKAKLFSHVAQYGIDKLQENYKTWCAQFEPTIHLSRVLDKLPQEYHQPVAIAYGQKFKEIFAENPDWSDVKCSAEAMHVVIKELYKQVSDDFANNKISCGGRVPTRLDVHCVNETRKECRFENLEMSVVSQYGGDTQQFKDDEISVDD